MRPGRTAVSLLVLAAGLGLLAGCGKKGALTPAWTITQVKPPRAVSNLKAEALLGRVWLTWTEPTINTDRSQPARIDRYLVYYNVLPIEAEYCLTCPLDFARKLEVDPVDPGEARFEEGRVRVPVTSFSSDKKYVFVVITLSPEGKSAGDSNIAVLNWPLAAEEGS